MNNTKSIHVTDHALVRWLERVHGVDMDFFRQQITKDVKAAASVGAASITVNGHCYSLDYKHNVPTVTTVLDAKMRAQKGPGSREKHKYTPPMNGRAS